LNQISISQMKVWKSYTTPETRFYLKVGVPIEHYLDFRTYALSSMCIASDICSSFTPEYPSIFESEGSFLTALTFDTSAVTNSDFIQTFSDFENRGTSAIVSHVKLLSENSVYLLQSRSDKDSNDLLSVMKSRLQGVTDICHNKIESTQSKYFFLGTFDTSYDSIGCENDRHQILQLLSIALCMDKSMLSVSCDDDSKLIIYKIKIFENSNGLPLVSRNISFMRETLKSIHPLSQNHALSVFNMKYWNYIQDKDTWDNIAKDTQRSSHIYLQVQFRVDESCSWNLETTENFVSEILKNDPNSLLSPWMLKLESVQDSIVVLEVTGIDNYEDRDLIKTYIQNWAKTGGASKCHIIDVKNYEIKPLDPKNDFAISGSITLVSLYFYNQDCVDWQYISSFVTFVYTQNENYEVDETITCALRLSLASALNIQAGYISLAKSSVNRRLLSSTSIRLQIRGFSTETLADFAKDSLSTSESYVSSQIIVLFKKYMSRIGVETNINAFIVSMDQVIVQIIGQDMSVEAMDGEK
jgi:hypothetical protein